MPDQGHSPGIIGPLSAGHSHRLTSGGKAETDMAMPFEAKRAWGAEEPRRDAKGKLLQLKLRLLQNRSLSLAVLGSITTAGDEGP